MMLSKYLPRFRRLRSYPVFRQHDLMDCGPSCLRMVAKYHGRRYQLSTLRERCHLQNQGVSLLDLSRAAESIGFRTLSALLPLDKLRRAPLPCVAYWQQNHFLVVYEVGHNHVLVGDPAHGLVNYTCEEFSRGWQIRGGRAGDRGAVLLCEPTPRFYEAPDEGSSTPSSFAFMSTYLSPYRGYFGQLALGLGATTAIALLIPFLTQALVDIGVQFQDLGFVYSLLAAHLALWAGKTSLEFIRSWLVLHVGARVNMAVLSDFLWKLMRLPVGFFDARRVGDILQRMGDQARIERFLTTATLNIAFSILTTGALSLLLLLYAPLMFAVFVGGLGLAVLWLLAFARRRRELDYKRFSQMSQNQSTTLHIVQGIREIKLNGCEQQKRWEWERVQAELFHLNVKSTALAQYQESGVALLLELKDIAITFIAAQRVIEGQMTLGMMLAVQYMLGQLGAPLNQLLGFANQLQDAQLGLERLKEVHNEREEARTEETGLAALPPAGAIELRNVSFRYGGPNSPLVLNDLSLTIPEGKVTALVGASGSGKTTLLKLLLRFYEPTDGEICVGGVRLSTVGHRAWRECCGVVMQDGYLFSDTIARNIALGSEHIDRAKLQKSAQLARIDELVDSLPLGFATKVGEDGIQLSRGQDQRVLIARAVYKDGHYLFFDEATSALDANNERSIVDSLHAYCQGKTVLIIAHRLSTVRHANQIVVLDRGRVVEQGTHEELARARGAYFRLVQNQLELGG